MYEIRNGKPDEADFTFYGQARDFVVYRGREAILHGPAETGKTISTLYYLHICACKYPKAQIVIARKTLASCIGSVLQTFINKVLDEDAPVDVYGGSKPEWFDYPNASRIWVAGFDKQSKALSTERDIIYVNQAEELDLGDWETATTRATGRAGNMPYGRVIGDANPSYPQHWMYHRDRLRLFYSFHKDNPVLYDPVTGEVTEQGRATMETLQALTGVRRKRLYEGKPAQAEGVVYEDWDEAIHYIYQDKAPTDFKRYLVGMDWGYTHPAVMGLFGEGFDGDLYLVVQFYHTKRNIDWWIERGLELKAAFRPEVFICDPSQPAYIEQFNQAGLRAVGANNEVLPGINAVQQRLKDNRLFVLRDSLRQPDQSLRDARKPYAVEHEFAQYVWADNKAKEQPVKEEDDGMDMIRYVVIYVDTAHPPPVSETVDYDDKYYKPQRKSRWD